MRRGTPMPLPHRRRAVALCLTLLGCSRVSTPASAGPAQFTGANPFASASPLLYQAPPFDRIHDADYQPALEEGMRQQLVEVARIAADSAAPSFDNTIVALERSGALLTRAFKVFNAMTQANTDDTLQRVQTEEAPRLAAHLDAIHLNDTLFRRVRSVYDRRADVGLDSVQTFLVERYYRDFVRAGALLAPADKARLRRLNQEESKLATDFQNRLLAATKAGAIVVGDKNELDGLSDAEIAAAAESARQRRIDGKWVLPLQNTTQQPAQASLPQRPVLERGLRRLLGGVLQRQHPLPVDPALARRFGRDGDLRVAQAVELVLVAHDDRPRLRRREQPVLKVGRELRLLLVQGAQPRLVRL